MEDSSKPQKTPTARKKFYLGWLALGLLQLFSLDLLQGCAPQAQAQLQAPAQNTAQASDSLLSNGDPQGSAVPVMRVNLDFFTSPLEAKVTAGAAAQASATSWQDEPTTEPAPDPSQGTVVADFRDHVGCLVFSQLGEARLCFYVMGDVSNLGINDREMQLEGLAQAGCATGAPAEQGSPLTIGGFHVVSAQQGSGSLSLEFAPNAGCSGGNIRIELQTG